MTDSTVEPIELVAHGVLFALYHVLEPHINGVLAAAHLIIIELKILTTFTKPTYENK